MSLFVFDCFTLSHTLVCGCVFAREGAQLCVYASLKAANTNRYYIY